MTTDTAALTLNPPPDLNKEASAVLTWAKSLTITTADDYTGAVERLKVVKSIAKRAAEFFAPMKKSADDTKKKILEAERMITIPLAQAEELAKSALLTFQREQDAIAEKERQKAQAEADQRAREEQERLEKQAAKLKSPEKKAALLERAENIVAPVIAVESKVPDVAGASTRKTWKAEIVNLAEFMTFARVECRADLLLPNEKVLDAYAKALKEAAKIPGVRFYQTESMAIGGR